jgi:hypothetical protein
MADHQQIATPSEPLASAQAPIEAQSHSEQIETSSICSQNAQQQPRGDFSNVAVPPTFDYPKAFNPLRRRFSVSAEPVTQVPANSAEAAAVVQAEIQVQESNIDQPRSPEEKKSSESDS